MWKRFWISMLGLLTVGSFAYALFADKLFAAGHIDGSPNNEAATSLTLGDHVHMGGSAMSDDVHTVLGTKDGYLYLLRTNSANNGVLSNYNHALNYANTTYKTQLGNVGSAHFSLSGNAVSLISKTELQNLSLVSSDALNASIPQISDKWWLKDANTSTNRASFVSAANTLNADGGIRKTTVSEIVYNDPSQGGTCSTVSAGEFGVMPINQFNAATVAKSKYVSSAKIRFDFPTAQGMLYVMYPNGNCSGDSNSETYNNSQSVMDYTLTPSGKESWIAQEEGGALVASLMLSPTHNWRPRVLLNKNDSFSINTPSLTTNFVGGRGPAGTCYQRWHDDSSLHVSANPIFDSPKTNKWEMKTFTITASISGTPTVTTINCPSLTNPAGSALIRPYLKVALNDILMRNNTKRSYAPSTSLSTTAFPKSDNVGEYLTLQTSTINVGLQNGASGVSGNRYQVKKPSGGSVITLPLSFSGPMEGDRYVSAEATDKNGNEVYGVLKAVGSATSDSVDIDFANLLADGSDSFQVTLYLEDAGSKNTAYRSQGTTITVEFQKSASSLSFTDPDTTNIKLGSADVKETITTDNTEIAVSGSNAVKYTLSGGISGTGLSITNDPVDPKGFTISIGNTPNPNLPTDFTLTAELETTNSTKATATKQIHVFQGMSDFKWIPVKTGSLSSEEAASGKKMGDLIVSNGLPKFTYELTSPSDSGYDPTKARDNGNFVIANTALDSNQKAEVKTNTSLSPGTYQIQCKVTDAYGDVLYTDFTITVGTKDQDFMYTDISGTELPKTGSKYNEYKETYAPNKTFQLYTAGYPIGSSVTYQLKAGGSSDVISVDSNGLVTILNASLDSDRGKVIVEATSHDPSGTYEDKTIELPIMIEQGTRTIEFADNPIYVPNGSGSVTPNIYTDGVLDTDSNTRIEVDPNEDNSIVWTNDGKTIHYDYSGDNGKDILLHVTKQGDRNYKAAQADGILHIIGAKENVLTLSTPGKIVYGDHFTIQSTQDDTNSTNVRYTFETDNTVFISAPQVSGNKAEFDALGNSGNTQITITVTREADGEVPLSKQVKIKVLPKPITIRIDDKEKKRLEDNPPLTYQDITSQLVSWNGVLDDVNTDVIKLSTSAGKYSPIGSYPITAKNVIQQLNDNYPNYTFTLKEGTLNILDNGNKDFWDPDGDGCPDLNIKLKDENGNLITINGDSNDDGIPDVNIDSNGDGKADLNIDTDNDGKPDMNLVILKEWKPTQCVTLGDIQYASGINAKAEINIDLNGDMIPDINIDHKGDFQPHLNISKDGKTPSINITVLHDWNPHKDYKKGNFAYDSIGTDKDDPKPELNIDTDDDGRPDLNLDLDGDGIPDLNVDVDGDWIPDMNIDSMGDGKPDINVDKDGDGKPDENIIEITEWKPEQNVDKPFPYDTMKIESKPELEDHGVIINKPDGSPFLPNMALKVTDVTKDKKEEVNKDAKDFIKSDQEVKQVYDVKLLENGIEVKPDGTLTIRIPIKEEMKHPILIKQKEDGGYEKIEAIIENDYLVYESDELGIVSIIADIKEEQPKPDNEIKGNYYPGANVGGALTGDTTDVMIYIFMGCLSCGFIFLLLWKRNQVES